MEASLKQAEAPFVGKTIVSDLHWLIRECDDRLIVDGTKWASEILCYLPAKWIEEAQGCKTFAVRSESVSTRLSAVNRFAILARNLLVAKEFHRAEFYYDKARNMDSEYTFMYYWTRYLKAINEDLENEIESIERKAADLEDEEQLLLLYRDIQSEDSTGFDCFMHYLKGMLQRSLHMREEAKRSFVSSIKKDIRFWPSWSELATLVEDADEVVASISMATNTWMSGMFEMISLPRFHLFQSAVAAGDQLATRGLGTQPTLLIATARCYNQMLEHDLAIDRFQQAHELDPYRVEEMNLFSDSLYIRMDRVRLASLAHSFFRTHKYSWETCCIVANYYSIRGEHEQSIRFLHRALRINPHSCASTWTLIGHEFMELKNHSAASMAYRKAIEKDPSDHRGWYGLGQLYDILKMHNYALYYYQKAHKCKPQDSRMLVALAEVYQRLSRNVDAEKCLIKAYKVGDVEGTALLHLAKHYETLQLKENAACVYTKYIEEYKASTSSDVNAPASLLYLARYHSDVADYELASDYAQRCLEFEQVRHEAGSILRCIQQRQKLRRSTNRRISPRGMPAVTPSRRLDLNEQPIAEDKDNHSEELMAVSDGEDDVSF